MYKIKTPNPHYNGITNGIKFNNGIGETDSEIVKNILVNEFKYTLILDEKEDNNKEDEKDIDYDTMSYNDLKSLASDKGINTHGMKKAEIIKALKEGE